MKKTLLIIVLVAFCAGLQSQEKEEIKLYNPELDGMEQIDEAIIAAATSGKHVFVILDSKGKRIHTQDSGILEEGKGYNRKHVMGFFRNWTVMAVDPATYKK